MPMVLWLRLLPALLFAAAVPVSAAGAALQPCRVPGIKNEVRCGVLPRPLDPARPAGAAIDVHYVVVPAITRRKLDDPVVLLAGGPGQSAIAVAPHVLPLLARLNQRRDVVFVDQRGTGRSAPLECEDARQRPLAEQADPARQFDALMRCRQRLQKLPYGDLRFFTTPLAMQDLDAVRARLGADRINLVGVSYGTRAALDYLRQFPEHVRRSVLDGVAPPDMVLPYSVAGDSQAALDAVFAACEAAPACRQAHADLRARWTAVLDGLPKTVTLAHPLTGERQTFTLTRERMLAIVRGPLYAPAIAAALPQAIEEAAHGRYEALFGLDSLFAARPGMAAAMGMHFSVVCAEDYPRMRGAAPDTPSIFERDFTRLYERVCAQWPRGELPAAFYRLRPSASPVLLLSGGDDPVTPPHHGERVAQALGARARHVVLPHAGHGVAGIGCMPDVLYRFIAATDEVQALKVDAACAMNIPRPPAYQPLVLPLRVSP